MSGTTNNPHPGAQPASAASLRDIYYIVFRHKWKVLYTFIGVLAAVTFYTFLLPEYYRSEAKILIRLGRESVGLDPTATTGDIVPISQTRIAEINSNLEILKSRELVESVVDEIGVEAILDNPDEYILEDSSAVGVARDIMRQTRKNVRGIASKPAALLEDIDLKDKLRARDQAILNVIGNMRVESPQLSNLIAVTYESKSPVLAQQVIAKLIDYYILKHGDVYHSSGSFDFFIGQTDTLRTRIAKMEVELKDLKNRTGISSTDEQRTILINRMGQIRQDIDFSDAAIAAARAKVAELGNNISGLPEVLETSKITGDPQITQHLFSLQLKEQELLSKYTEKNQMIQEVRRQIEEAKSLLAGMAEIHQGINPTLQLQLQDRLVEQANLASLEAQYKALKRQLEQANAQLQQLNDNEILLEKLNRDLKIAKENYIQYSEHLEQARIDNELKSSNVSNISIVQSPTFPMKPVRPRKIMNISLGFLLAAFSSIAFAFLLEYMDNSIKTQEQVEEKLKLKTLVVIPDHSLGRS